MSNHATSAEQLAERAGGYLQAAETTNSKTPGDWAAMADASATLAVAQRLAALDDRINSIGVRLGEIRAELNRDDSPAAKSVEEALTRIADVFETTAAK
jgi:hypothetical protein